MRHFVHPQRIHWKELRTGMTLSSSKYNDLVLPTVIDSIYNCSNNNNLCSRVCHSHGVAVMLEGVVNCIFNSEGNSFWEEVEDIC